MEILCIEISGENKAKCEHLGCFQNNFSAFLGDNALCLNLPWRIFEKQKKIENYLPFWAVHIWKWDNIAG